MITRIPNQVIEADEYLVALATLEQVALAFAAGNGWDFLAACREAQQKARS